MEIDAEEVQVWRVSEEVIATVGDVVAREFPLTIILDDRELVTLLCSPVDMKNLAVGFLSSEGLISTRDDLKKIIVDDVRGVVRIETYKPKVTGDEVFKRFISSGCGRGASFYSAADITGMPKIESTLHISPRQITSLFKEFQRRSLLYRSTGGVHSAALCDFDKIVVFSEDVGRHNAVDKIFGKCLLEATPTDNMFVLTSGRISSEILLKVARRNIPLLASKSAPTNLGVKLATDLGITLLGFVRGSRMNVYANYWRIE